MGLEIVTDVLLIKGELAATGLVFIKRPKPRAIRRKNFINENHFPIQLTKFKLGISDDDTPFAGVISCFGINLQAQLPYLLSGFQSDNFHSFLERNNFDMPFISLGTRGKEWLFKLS